MMTHRIHTYLNVWRLNASNTLQKFFINRATNMLFLLGKIVRLIMSLLFLFLIKNQVAHFSSYTPDQVLIFFLTYQFIDTLSQIFYRGVYIFRDRIVRGTFDFMLLRPINPLFQALTDQPDLNDAIFIIPTTLLSIHIALRLDITITPKSLLLYFLLLINAFIITTSLHILVLVMGILTKDVQGIIWIYRDLMKLGRFPAKIYLEPLRSILFFVIPVGMIISIPAEVLLNLTPTHSIFISCMTGGISWIISTQLWKWSLKKYQGASS